MATTSKMNIQKGILPDADPVLLFDVEGVGRLDAEGVVGDIQTTVIGDVFDQSSESLNILVADFCHGSPHRVLKRMGVGASRPNDRSRIWRSRLQDAQWCPCRRN